MALTKLAPVVEDDVRPGADRTDQLVPPLVSVIVVCFNHAPFLEKCLNSIVRQSYPQLQLIVVDNRSTDMSRQVIERFGNALAADPRGLQLEAIFSETNDREMGAMLQGFAKARGRYIAFVDGDDWLLPQCIETHIKAHLVSRIAVGVTSVDMYQSAGEEIVVGTGKRVSDFVMSKRGQQSDFCRMENLAAFDFPEAEPGWQFQPGDLHLVTPAMAHEWYWSPTSGLCFRREAIELMFNPTPTLRDGADGFLVRGISCLTGGITIDRSLAVYRTHGSNLFTRHPALENILQYQRDQCADLDTDICEAVLRCFHEQAPALAQSLEIVDIYIDAINSLSKVALNRQAGPFSSYTVRFLMENQDLLVRCFGAATYRRWKRKYMRLNDYLTQALRRNRHH